MANKLIIPKDDPNFSDRDSGVVQGISHDMIIELLKANGYIRKKSVVRGLKIDEHRVNFYLD